MAASVPEAGKAETTPVSAIMTRRVVTLETTAPLDGVLGTFVSHGISGVPVVDAGGRAIGMLSKTDLLRSGEGVERPSTVGDAMTPIALSVPEHASIARASGLMATEGIHRVLVIGSDGRLVGILSSIDILRWLARAEGYGIPA